MRGVLGQLWTTITTLLQMVNIGAEAGKATAEWAKEAAEELRDEARAERLKRAEQVINAEPIEHKLEHKQAA